ncbi:sigma 54-interacting transcriptional regulator [Aneurinibacillus sp. Ricciae_BoGa-3]|uniref:sigma 54-interacting transcriptional regulator n=1 Tax=Aneurinibacillus sp. Ricciae_BoGa-3 TaxID=3022697 RepID=UPI0023416555|nr:sigma 54-interacting transcriptional regulator [Aneurinibacillus sp. Ricciae_BoGa-3]WCK53417.1 sigma 54-interacting transcriptional regulator [Aneurinibacillus sp. Ricciae_BoGa-3]
MIVWKEILQSIQTTVDQNSTIQRALEILHESQQNISLVCDQDIVVGYVNISFLLQQLQKSQDLHQTIEYYQNILKVPRFNPVEFYHNISVVLGVDLNGNVTGFCTMEQARSIVNQLELEQINRIFNGAEIGIITTDADFNVTFINEMAENILGLSSSFLLYRNYKTLLDTNKKNLEEVLSGKQFVCVDCSLNYKHIIGNFSPLMIEGKISGIVHIFGQGVQWERAVQELEFVRDISEDLQAIYSSSYEQILVVNSEGNIIRLAGTFLKSFWGTEDSQLMIGRNVKELEEEGIFTPNVFDLCKNKRAKVFSIQETLYGRKIWSVANPVFHEGKLEKIVIVSQDIDRLGKKLGMVQTKSDELNQELNELIEQSDRKKKLIYRSRLMENLVDEMKRIASVHSTVMLIGESGVGKEVFAHAIHDYSQRKTQPFIRVNCGAIPENLIESELFGYEKGAFTGADQKGKPGLFEMANGGTLLLDEISELPPNMQVKLLRVLQEREVVRVGGIKTIPIDVRIIASANRDLRELVQQNLFREDLYYRLNVIPIRIPPLRERPEDIASLSMHFLQQFNQEYIKNKSLSLDALEVLENYNWPGNVRELQNIIERLFVTSRENFIDQDDVLSILYTDIREKKGKPMIFEIMPLKEAVAELERQLIDLALRKYGTAAKVSQILGVSQATISRRINNR